MTLDEFRNHVTQQRNAQQQLAINAIKTIAQSTTTTNKLEGNK